MVAGVIPINHLFRQIKTENHHILNSVKYIGVDSYNKYHSNYIYLLQPVIWVIIGFSIAVFSIGLRYWLQDLHIMMRWWKWLLLLLWLVIAAAGVAAAFTLMGEGEWNAGKRLLLFMGALLLITGTILWKILKMK